MVTGARSGKRVKQLLKCFRPLASLTCLATAWSTSGGGGTGGCILTGPYEPMIMPKDDFSDESFESTEESDAALDITGPVGLTHNNFSNTEVVWAKRPALPWFPGIVSLHAVTQMFCTIWDVCF